MEFQDVVRKRRMVRNFDDRPIPDEMRDRILTNALHAPSAGFSQGWAFMTFEGPEETESFWDVTFAPRSARTVQVAGMFNAPLIVVPFSSMDDYLDRYAEPDKGWTDRDPNRWPVPYWHIDTGMASLLMLLTCVDEGLGALFFGIFDIPGVHGPLSASRRRTRRSARSRSAIRPPTSRRRRSSADAARWTSVLHRARW